MKLTTRSHLLRSLLEVTFAVDFFQSAAAALVGTRGAGGGLRGLNVGNSVQVTSRDLADVSDKLGGILDAVENSYASVKSGLTSLDSACDAQTAAVQQRLEQQRTAMTDLDNARVRYSHYKGVAEAELSHLAEQEDEAVGSYNSAVLRRAVERQNYLDSNAKREQEVGVLSQVVDHLQSKQLEIGNMPSSAGESLVHSKSTPGQLAYVLGIFSTMHETASQDMSEESAQAKQGDKELLDLVASYKAQLTHVNDQYEVKMAEKVQFETDIQSAQEESLLRGDIAKNEEQTSGLLLQLCGPAGQAPTMAAEGDKLLETFRTQVDLALSNIAQETGSTLVQTRAAALRGLLGADKVAVPRKPSVAKSQPQQVLTGKVQLALVRQGLHVHRNNQTQTSDNSTAAQCADDKQSLTAQILSTRQELRVAQQNLQASQQKVAALGSWRVLAADSESALSETRNALVTGWAPLSSIIAQGSFSSVLADASTELQNVDAEVRNYSSSTAATPRAAAIVKAVEAVTSTLQSIEGLPLAVLESSYGDMQIQTAALVESLNTKKQDLVNEQGTTNGTVQTAETDISSLKSNEAALMAQLQAVDAHCESVLYNTTQLLTLKRHVGLAAVKTALDHGGFADEGASRRVPHTIVRPRRVSSADEAKAWRIARQLLGQDLRGL